MQDPGNWHKRRWHAGTGLRLRIVFYAVLFAIAGVALGFIADQFHWHLLGEIAFLWIFICIVAAAAAMLFLRR